MTELLAFLAVAAVVIVTPGQDTALTIRNVLLGGRAAGIFTTLGVCAGQATWAVITAAGLGALLVASQPVFGALKLLGSAYLIFLGGRALREAIRGTSEPAGARAEGGQRLRPAIAFRQGLLSNLGNPKMLVFFASLLPQFGRSAGELVVLGLLFCLLTMGWLVLYSIAVARIGDVLRRASVRRKIEAISGTVLIALGLRLATEPA
jgi:threonine/homoserine/homoserine lactone efflux protein